MRTKKKSQAPAITERLSIEKVVSDSFTDNFTWKDCEEFANLLKTAQL